MLAQFPPVSYVLFLRALLRLAHRLDPRRLLALVVLSDDLLRELLAVVREAILVERSDHVGHQNLAVGVTALDFAVLVDESRAGGVPRHEVVHLARNGFEGIDVGFPCDVVGFLTSEISV